MLISAKWVEFLHHFGIEFDIPSELSSCQVGLVNHRQEVVELFLNSIVFCLKLALSESLNKDLPYLIRLKITILLSLFVQLPLNLYSIVTSTFLQCPLQFCFFRQEGFLVCFLLDFELLLHLLNCFRSCLLQDLVSLFLLIVFDRIFKFLDFIRSKIEADWVIIRVWHGSILLPLHVLKQKDSTGSNLNSIVWPENLPINYLEELSIYSNMLH